MAKLYYGSKEVKEQHTNRKKQVVETSVNVYNSPIQNSNPDASCSTYF